MIVYLAGPMTSLPLLNFPAFDEARDALRARRHKVISPADLDRAAGFDAMKGDTLDGYAPADLRAFLAACYKRDLAGLCDADAIALLPGYMESKGAMWELCSARLIGLHVYEYERGGKLRRVEL